jgi:hypothetical protein
MIDYAPFSTTNRNTETGIRYGMIALNSLVDMDANLLNLPNPDLDEAFADYCRDRLLTLAAEGEVTMDDLAVRDEQPEDATTDDVQDWICALSPETCTEILDTFEDASDFWDGIDSSYVGCEGTIDGVSVRVTELGGALMLWVFDSPHIGWYAPCSPCVPGAGDLDTTLEESLGLSALPRGDLSKLGVLTYDVPPSWRSEEI